MRSVAVVGSGPSGLFLAKNLFKALKGKIKIDIFEKSKVPFGLLKYGVAPDHPEVKKKFMSHFRPLFEEAGESLSLYLNVDIGTTIPVDRLKENYDLVVLCTGMSNSKRNWPSIAGSYGADQVVGWYNKSPEFEDFHLDLKDAKNVVIVGNGNVALDIARILSRPVHDFQATDINPAALHELERTGVEKITILGRRGPLEMSFSPAELRELVALKGGVAFSSSIHDLSSYFRTENTRIQDKNLKILQNLITAEKETAPKSKQVEFRFFEPIEAIDENTRTIITKNSSNLRNYIKFNILIECIGFCQSSIIYPTFQHEFSGLVKSGNGHLVSTNVYSCGWARTGPKGTIADSMIEAEKCAKQIVQDIERSRNQLDITCILDLKGLSKWKPVFE